MLTKTTFVKLSLSFGYVCFFNSHAATAQIIPDNTFGAESSVVAPQGLNSTIDTVEGGATRGSNLFHSFDQFSVTTGRTTYFNNAVDIQNIFSRVTGRSISNIDGLIQANGTANLFLLNPNGIMFGPNASLNIGGSFLASTADSLNFADGNLFSATTPQSTFLLTISVPTGLGFGSNPGEISVQGTGHRLNYASPTATSPIVGTGQSLTGLRTALGRSLALLGGQIIFEGGILTAPSGQIQIGSVAEGVVGLTSIEDSFNYDNVSNFQDIQLNKRSLVDASGAFNGKISLKSKNLHLNDGSLITISNFGNSQTNEINIKTTESLLFRRSPNPSDFSLPVQGIITQNFSEGKEADISILAKNIKIQDFSAINTNNYGGGRGGNITVNVQDTLSILGKPPLEFYFFPSFIGTLTYGSGEAGDMEVIGKHLSLQDGGIIFSQTLSQGSAGNITTNFSESIEIAGGFPINLETNSFISSTLGTFTVSSGDAGDVFVNTRHLTIKSGGLINATTSAAGAAGNIKINAADIIEIEGKIPNSLGSDLFNLSRIVSTANRNNPFLVQTFNLPDSPLGIAGSIDIDTKSLNIRAEGRIGVINEGIGDAGTIKIDSPSIFLDTGGSITAETLLGTGGDINVQQTQNLQLRRGSAITATARGGIGSGGNIKIRADNLVALENSDITANAFEGQGGNIQINAQGLFLSPDSEIRASSEAGPQFDGVVQVNTPDIDFARATVQPVGGPESPEITSVCQGRSGTAISKLTNTGTGGVPVNRTAPLSSTSGWQGDSSTQVANNSKKPKRLTTDKPMQIIEAQGWKRNANGTVSMTAEVLETVPYSSLATLLCSTNQSDVNVEKFRQ